MAKAHEGPGVLVPFPSKYGGGKILLRELPLKVERQIRGQVSESAHAEELGEKLVIASIVEVSPDIAIAIGASSDASERGLVPVDANAPGREEVYDHLGRQRRSLLTRAWLHAFTVPDAENASFFDGLQILV